MRRNWMMCQVHRLLSSRASSDGSRKHFGIVPKSLVSGSAKLRNIQEAHCTNMESKILPSGSSRSAERPELVRHGHADHAETQCGVGSPGRLAESLRMVDWGRKIQDWSCGWPDDAICSEDFWCRFGVYNGRVTDGIIRMYRNYRIGLIVNVYTALAPLR